jgi:hypothetical protein
MSQLFRRKTLQIVIAVHESARTGGPVRIGAASDEMRRLNHQMPSLVEAALR